MDEGGLGFSIFNFSFSTSQENRGKGEEFADCYLGVVDLYAVRPTILYWRFPMTDIHERIRKNSNFIMDHLL
jgi:hypothetical protein